MWQRAAPAALLEHQVLQQEGFTQFSVYHDQSSDTYYASGYDSIRTPVTISGSISPFRPVFPMSARRCTSLTHFPLDARRKYTYLRLAFALHAHTGAVLETEWFRSATGVMTDGILAFSFIRSF